MCSMNCRTCLNDSLKGEKCTSCFEGYFLDSASQTCQPIHYSCATASGLSATDCITCKPNFVKSANLCSPKCPQGSFFDHTIGACSICHRYCAECQGPTAYNCTACTSSFMLVANDFVTDLPTGPETGFCKIICKSGYYNIGEYPNECRPCATSCKTCSGPGENACLTCEADHFLDNGRCGPCHRFCKTCNGSSPWNCLTCNTDFELDSSGFCKKSTCASGMAFSVALQTCIFCH